MNKFILLTDAKDNKYILSTKHIDYVTCIDKDHENYKIGFRSLIYIQPQTLYTDEFTYLTALRCKEKPEQIFEQLKA